MAPQVSLELEDIPSIHCSGRDISKELEALLRSFEEKSDWKRRLGALKRLQGLVLGSSEVLRPLLPRCREALLNQVQDLRSALVREACATLQLMACTFRGDFEFFAVPALPVLLKSTSVTILIIAESCNQCATALVRECRTSRLLQVLLDHCRVKNGTQRCRAMQLLLVSLQQYSSSTLERHCSSIEKVLKESLEDSQPGVRTAARHCFWAFQEKFQEHAKRFMACLDAAKQRQLRLLASLEAEQTAAPVLLGTSSPVAEPDAKPKAREAREARSHRLSAWSAELQLPPPALPVPTPGSCSSRSTEEGSAEQDLQTSGGSAEASQGTQELELLVRETRANSAQSAPTAEPDPFAAEETYDSSSDVPSMEPAEALPAARWPSVQQMRALTLERQGELLRSMGSDLGDEETLKRLENFAEMRLPSLKGPVLTDLLQELLRACGMWPRPTRAVASIEQAALRSLRALYVANGDAFRAAAGDLHPLPFNALTALLPELSPAAAATVQAPARPSKPKPASWANEGHRLLVAALKGLTSSNRQAKAASLESLQELMQHPECCEDFAEVLASKLVQCHGQSSGELKRKSLRLLERLLAAILPLRAMEILLPLVTEADLALSLLPLSLRRLPPRQALDHLVLILPALSTALSCDVAETRKAAILCLVELYLSVGEEALEVFGKELAPSQLKLVVMYAERQRSPSSNGSPKLSSEHKTKLD